MDTTPAQAPKTPWDKKAERLEAAIARVDGEVAAVNTRHAEKITHHNDTVEVCERAVAVAHQDEERAEGRLLGARDLIAQLERQLTIAREAAIDAEVAHVEAQTDHVRAKVRAVRARRERDTALAEPNRHLAALAHDRRRLADRLTLHKARAPRAALFG